MAAFAMYTRKDFLLILVLVCSNTVAEASPQLGRQLSPDEVAGLATHIFADGEGLPAGQGNSVQGKLIYTERCAGCHGDHGQGGSAMELLGDRSLLTTEYPDRGIAVYWPYAPGLFEYIKRAMPPAQPYSLSDDELYSVIAWLLEINGLIEAGQRVDAALLSGLIMPNRNGFRSIYQPPGQESPAENQ